MLGVTKPTSFGGRLTGLENGLVKGEIVRDETTTKQERLTIELLANGIPLKVHSMKPGVESGPVVFEFSFEGFPAIALPCAIRGRVLENDRLLDGEIRLDTLDDVWGRMMPFQVEIETIEVQSIFLRLKGTLPRTLPVLELRSWGTVVSQSVPDGTPPNQLGSLGTRLRIDIPMQLRDGGEHRIGIFDRASGLPVSAWPIQLRSDGIAGPGQTLTEIEERLTNLERELKSRSAEAFRSVTAPLYRHIDQLIQLQRSNFENEIGALRMLLGASESEKTQAVPLLSSCLQEMSDPIVGYGLNEAEVSSTGKSFRWVEPSCGLLLPGLMTNAPLQLHLQGLRRAHSDALQDAVLYVNGARMEGKLYLNPTSESWNLQAELPAALLRSDRNLVELRTPYGSLEGGREANGNKAVGLMFIQISPLPNRPDPGGKVQE